MVVKEHICLPIPRNKDLFEIKVWCRKYLNGRTKIKYHRKYNRKTKRWGRDYDRRPMIRFLDDADAVAFKIQWTEG